MLTDIMGYIGALLISIAFLPQTYKLFKTKNTKGLSLICYLIYHLGLTLFIIYASLATINTGKTDYYPLLIANVFSWIVNSCLLFLICYNFYHKNYQKKDDKNQNRNKIKNGEGNAIH